MIIIDHLKCTSCGDDFDASVRRLEELVLIPECTWCGSFRTQLKLRWEEFPLQKKKENNLRWKSGIKNAERVERRKSL